MVACPGSASEVDYEEQNYLTLRIPLQAPLMESIGVLMTVPVNRYLEEELDKRFKLFRFWTVPEKSRFFATHKDSIRAVVGKGGAGADAAMIDALPKLEIVANHGVGLDKIDLGKCKEKGIRVTSTPDVLTDDVADLAIGLILAVLRKLCASDRYVRSGKWKKGNFALTTKVYNLACGLLTNERTISSIEEVKLATVGFQIIYCLYSNVLQEPVFSAINLLPSLKLSQKAVGIIGLGRIGMAIAKRAEAFGCSISYYSRTQKPKLNYKYYPSVVELASNCHILAVACALTDETLHIINREVIDALGPAGIIVNIGRGSHIDELELVAALVEGRLGGVGLDVFEHEPHVPEELFGLHNVVLSPHVGTATLETRKVMAELVLGNLEAHFLGKPLLTPVV